MLEQITPLIITCNEEANIARTLGKLGWASQILVVDSGSTDRTLSILQGDPRVRVVHHAFSDFAGQCNFGLAQIAGDWVLSLDADYELSDDLIGEMARLAPPETVAGYRAGFVYRSCGRPLRGTLYPPRVILFRRLRTQYRQEGHAHRAVVAGDILRLRGRVYHDDRKPLARWLAAQHRYASAEAAHLLGARESSPGWADRLRLMAWPAPLAVLFYTLFVKGCVLDGWPGWYYALQRLIAEALLALELIDRRLSAGAAATPDSR